MRFAFLWLDTDWWWLAGSVLAGLALLLYLCRYRLVVRLPLWMLRHTVYRLHVSGSENVPATGPVLVVANHVSRVDPLLLIAALRRRMRVVVWTPHGSPLLRLFLRLAGAILVDGSTGPRAIIHALRTAAEALENGEVVCLFAEGGITRTGFVLPFPRALEQIFKRSPGALGRPHLVPACLDHVWGSKFNGRAGSTHSTGLFPKSPRRFPYHVYLTFGPPLPPAKGSPGASGEPATAFDVRQAIQKLSADSAVGRASLRRPVHRQFVRLAARHPFLPCLIDTNNPKKPMLRYGEALAGAKVLADLLRPLLKDEAMVGLWIPPSAGGALANIAVALLGKAAVNLNYTASMPVVQSSIRQCGIRKVLTSKLFMLRVDLDPGPGVELIFLEDFRKKISTWKRLRAYLSVLFFPGFVQERWILGLGKHKPDDLAAVIFSSGSTGEPKGVMLTHANIAANAETMIQAIDPGPWDRLLGILPFFHSFGYSVTLWVPLQVGASAVFFANPLQAKEIGELCRKNRATIFLSTPTFLRSYLKRCEPGDFSSLRLLMCGAEKLPQAMADEFLKKFGVRPYEGYGCTELSPAAIVNLPDVRQGNTCQMGNKPGTIGRALPGVAARIVHRATRETLPPGEEGLLLVYGANVMKGYIGRDDLTKNKIVDGWYTTGDLARMDEDGFVTITGREERFAKVGGEMVPLEKVEDELHAILKASERVCAVTAIPDERKGERIVVLHLPLDGTDVQQVWEQLNARGLPNLFIPGPRDFFQVGELPILGSGKLDLKKCKEQAMEASKK
jgi:acyl-[acyl-carrier-protein]-phospholipid O-acyltransferase/long-chain-fatty-acid--[acyl-carrier-protein] ligase